MCVWQVKRLSSIDWRIEKASTAATHKLMCVCASVRTLRSNFRSSQIRLANFFSHLMPRNRISSFLRRLDILWKENVKEGEDCEENVFYAKDVLDFNRDKYLKPIPILFTITS